MKTKYKLILILFSGTFLNSVPASGWTDKTLFSQKAFIENKGQFKIEMDNGRCLMANGNTSTIRFGVLNSGVEIYFTPGGVIYKHTELVSAAPSSAPLKEKTIPSVKAREDEAEREKMESVPHYLSVEWQGSNPSCEIIAEDAVSFYFTYMDTKDASGKSSLKARAYKKIIYKNLYPNIDVEYVFPPCLPAGTASGEGRPAPIGASGGDAGIKYSLILHPGADASVVKMQYTGAEKISVDAEGNTVIKSSFGEFIDHAPQTFFADNKQAIPSSFSIKNNIISFSLSAPLSFGEGLGVRSIIIDPWTTIPTFSGYNRAYEVDYDLAGNVYIYGGFQQYQEIKLNSAGVIQWIFTANAFNSSPYPNNYGDCCVDRISGSSYIVEGYNGSGGARIIKVDQSGAQIGLYPGNQFFQEMWRVVYNNCTKKIIIAGGGPQMANQAALLDTNVATLTPVNVLATTLTYQDMCLLALDNSNDCFMATVKSVWTFPAPFNNMIIKCPGTTLLPASYILPDGHTFPEDYNKTYVKITTPSEAGLGYNGMAVSNKYLYTYDGAVIKRWNKNTGTLINAATINNRMFFNAGLEVDDCERIYAGVGKSVVTYDTTFTALSTIVTADTVFDLKLGPGNLLYVSGISFVSSFQLTTTPCSVLTVTVSSTPGSCASPATATAVVSGGTGPYTYVWNPSGQTTATATGLSTGTYTVTVSDASSACNPGANAQTATVTVTSTGSFSVTSTPASTSCNGLSDGTATAAASGGTAPYTYSWSPSGGTNSTATGLSSGTYTVNVTDASGCTGTQTVTVTQPAAITTTTSATSAACGSNSGTASVTAAGGSGSYTYLWNPSGAATATATGLLSGNYSVTVTDANGCTASSTVSVTPSGSITATATNATICAGQNAVLTASGGTNYSWSDGNTTNPILVSPASNTTYSVFVTAGSCADTAIATVVVNPSPTATAWNNVTITSGSSATLAASGGGTYSWSNGSSGSTISVSPPITTVYCVTVSNNNCIDTACVTVKVEQIDCTPSGTGELYLPNAFSPNGDGENDVLKMYFGNMHCIKEFEIHIYNRWGEIVYETTSPVVEWDGTYKEKKEGSAVFVYYMKALLVTGEEIVKEGNISLVR